MHSPPLIEPKASVAPVGAALPLIDPFDALPITVVLIPARESSTGIPGTWKFTRYGRRQEAERKQRRRVENRRIILKLKAEGCWLCGRTDLPSSQMHFHHVRPETKKDVVCHLATRSTRALIEEIRKCRVLDVYCHKAHHEIIVSEAWRSGDLYEI